MRMSLEGDGFDVLYSVLYRPLYRALYKVLRTDKNNNSIDRFGLSKVEIGLTNSRNCPENGGFVSFLENFLLNRKLNIGLIFKELSHG